jgi:Zn-dependent peptidase ImmA (M78 family)
LRRGFKALAERSASATRSALGLSTADPLDPRGYAAHLGVVVLEFELLGLSRETANQLTVKDPESWSALTIEDQGVRAIVINPAHAPTRKRSDLTHELAHIELKHVPSRVEVSQTGVLLLSDYSDEQEQEADWQSAALLVPREGLVQLRAQGYSPEQIATHFGVSGQLCAWRLRMTGVDVQMRRARLRYT